MLKELVINENYFNTIFSEKDFNFINNFDNEIAELNSKISYQENIRDKVITFINSIADVLKSGKSDIDNLALYDLSNELTKVAELISTNIILLSDLGDYLTSLNRKIVNLLLTIDKNDYPEEFYEDDIKAIKYKIDDCTTFLNKTNEKLSINNLRIDTFLYDPNTKKYLDVFGITLKDCSDITSKQKESIKVIDYKVNENDSNVLIISEKDKKVFLPYKVDEINYYLEHFPENYTSFESVIANEFILPLDYYMIHPVISRFRETYSLCRDRESKSIFESLKYSMDMMFNRRLNPAIIAACKTLSQLTNYLNCLENNDLNSFKDFEIKFEINPF